MPRGIPKVHTVTREPIIKHAPTPDEIALAAFMEETVVVHFAKEKGIPVTVPISLGVNGVWQHVFRGVDTPIKRKYLEVAARAVTSEVEEGDLEPGETPASVTTPAHAFSVIRDTPEGHAWVADLRTQAR